MVYIFHFILLFLTIKSRNYEPIKDVKETIISNIKNMKLSLNINGPNDYIYNFESFFIAFNYETSLDYQYMRRIYIYEATMTIFFNLSIFEKNNNVLDLYPLKEVSFLCDKILTVNIIFDKIIYSGDRYYGFDAEYYYSTSSDYFKINYDNIKESNWFNYLLFNEINILYDNKTFFDYSKKIIFDYVLDRMNKNLINYPQCDQLFYFNALVEYFLNREFRMTPYFDDYYFYKEKVTKFEYNDIIRVNQSIILKGINVEFKLAYDNFDEKFEDEDDNECLELTYIKIDQNFNITYGNINLYRGIEQTYYFSIFKEIINASKDNVNII